MRIRFAAIALLAFGLCLGLAGAGSAANEAKKPFTIDDYFLTKSVRVDDMTADGRFLAATVTTPKDRLPQDHKRYGDPTYIGPSQAELLVIDTSSGRQTPVFAGKRQFRSPSWSPDGKTLALFILESGRYRPFLWRRETGKLEPVALPKDRLVASNSPLLWSPDGAKLYLTTRAADWEKRAETLFKNATVAPIIVMDTDDPFLQWDEIRRMDRLVVPAVWDLKARTLKELMPETPVSSLRLTKDGTALLFERDVTEKTSYDVIFGTKNQLEVLPLPSGEAR
ncbi:MAG: hypothetical protein R6X21_00140, partial [Candidatus Aminicenantes bacterium]